MPKRQLKLPDRIHNSRITKVKLNSDITEGKRFHLCCTKLDPNKENFSQPEPTFNHISYKKGIYFCRISAIFCATGAWGDKPVNKTSIRWKYLQTFLLTIKNFIKKRKRQKKTSKSPKKTKKNENSLLNLYNFNQFYDS